MRAEHREAEPAAPDWAGFAASQSRAQLLDRWLAILCAQVGGVRSALVLLASEEPDTFTPAARWPDARADFAALGQIAQRALAERRGMVVAHDGMQVLAPQGTPPAAAQAAQAAPRPGAYLAYPVELDSRLEGAIVLDAAARSEAQLQQALRLMHWGSAWIVDLCRQQQLEQQEQALQRMGLVQGVLASALQHGSLRPACLDVVNELATRLGCERVAIGFDEGEAVRVEAISHTAHFDPRAQLTRRIAEAMAETLDEAQPLRHPDPAATLGRAAHAALAAEAQGTAGRSVWSVPLLHEGAGIGVLCFERAEAPEASVLQSCQVLGLMLGPLLALQRANARSVPRRLLDAARDARQALFGPRHSGAKLLALLAVALLLFLALATGEHRVAAKTLVEGSALRAVSAPFEGYIAENLVRAGDTVREGQLLARLDDRDLQVEQARWQAEREQQLRKLRQVQAQHDWAAAAVISAQAEQAEAQLALVQQRLQRAALRAPVDGVVVTGDLRQLVGTPVELGKLLFEIAPLDRFRVVLQVDERDIAHVSPGQTGELLLSGLPGERLAFSVKQITPVAVADEGRNFFRVEADVQADLRRLRPGMEGVGKILAGERKLLWIWTHGLTDWARVALWSWLP